MKAWLHADPEVKRRYAPVARHGVAPARLPWRWEDPRYVAAWERVHARQSAAPCPLMVLRPRVAHVLPLGSGIAVRLDEPPASRRTVAVLLYVEGEPGAVALAVVEAKLAIDLAMLLDLAPRRRPAG